MTTRRDILKSGAGLAAILASGKAPAYLIKSMLAARNSIGMKSGGTQLPYDAEVEWIKSVNGDGYIDTGLMVNDFYLSIKTLTTNVGINTMYMFGAGDTASGIMMWRPGRYPSTLKRIYSDGSLVYEKANEPTEISDLHITASPLSHTLVLFNTRTSDGSVHSGNGGFTCYYLTIKDANGNKLREFIPVRFTNELGQSEGAMYDKVSGQLFRNQGTGAFLYGADKTDWVNPYVTDGLVAMWDGEWNAGGGVHDPKATMWKDLVGGADSTFSVSPEWDVNCLKVLAVNNVITFNSTNAVSAIGSDKFAIEIVARMDSLTGKRFTYICDATSYATLQIFTHNSSALFIMRQFGSMSSISAYGSDVIPASGSCSTVYDESLSKYNTLFFKNGAYSTQRNNTTRISLSALYSYMLNSGPIGSYYNLRIYSRALTAAEIAANYAIDKARFNLT